MARQDPPRDPRCRAGHVPSKPRRHCGLFWRASSGHPTRAVPGQHPTGPPPPHPGASWELAPGRGAGGVWVPGGVARAADGRPASSPCGSSCPQPATPLGLCRRQAPAPERLRAAFVQGAAGTHVRALGSSWRDWDPFPVPPPAGATPSPPAQGPPRRPPVLARCPLPLAWGHPLAFPRAARAVDEGCTGTAGAPVSSLPLCLRCSGDVPCPGRDARHPPALPGPVPAYQPGPSLAAPGHPCSSPLPHAAIPCLSFPPCRRPRPGRFPVSPSFPREEGGSFPPPFPRVPWPSQETVTSSGCAEPAPDSWHQRGGREPSPASSLLGPARVPPSPRAAAGPQRAPHGNAGTATQTPALPCPARCQIPSERGRRERGEGTGQWNCWRQRGGHGAGGCHAAGHGPRLQKVLASSRASGTAMPGGCPGPWQRPSPGDASGQSRRGKPGCSSLPHASASSCHGADPRHSQAPVPRCPPWEMCPLHRDTCQSGAGNGMG